MDISLDLPFMVKVAQSYLTVCRFDSNALLFEHSKGKRQVKFDV